MELIIKPTELCNFKCTFCSSTKIAKHKSDLLSHDYIFRFLNRFPNTTTIIVNGGDPLMIEPDYYWKIIDYLNENDLDSTIAITTNLWPFYKNPKKWTPLFLNDRVGVTTSFNYGEGRLKGDFSLFTEEDFWKCSDSMLEYIGYRPDFIAVITDENDKYAIKNVELAKQMSEDKIPINTLHYFNYIAILAASSNKPTQFPLINIFVCEKTSSGSYKSTIPISSRNVFTVFVFY